MFEAMKTPKREFLVLPDRRKERKNEKAPWEEASKEQISSWTKDFAIQTSSEVVPKLKIKGSCPFIVNKVFLDGTIEIKDLRDSCTFTTKEKGLKIYLGGEIALFAKL